MPGHVEDLLVPQLQVLPEDEKGIFERVEALFDERALFLQFAFACFLRGDIVDESDSPLDVPVAVEDWWRVAANLPPLFAVRLDDAIFDFAGFAV